MTSSGLWGPAYNLDEITPEDLLVLSNDATLSELYKGNVVQTPMTAFLHGFLSQKIGMLLAVHAQALGLPVMIAQRTLFDLTLPGRPRTVLTPYVAMVHTANLPNDMNDMPMTYIPQGGPWLAVEILSPTQTVAQMRIKANAYLTAGGAEVWIIDPIQHVIEVHSAAGMATYSAQHLLISTILPQFHETVQNLTTV